MTPCVVSGLLFFLAGVGGTLTLAAQIEKEPPVTVKTFGVISLTLFVGAIVLTVVR
jgi:hypothetical protein